MVAAEAFRPTKCTLTLPWFLKAVDKHVDLLALVLGKFIVNGSTVEVIAPDVAFQRDIVSGLRHGESVLHHEVTIIIIWAKSYSFPLK